MHTVGKNHREAHSRWFLLFLSYFLVNDYMFFEHKHLLILPVTAKLYIYGSNKVLYVEVDWNGRRCILRKKRESRNSGLSECFLCESEGKQLASPVVEINGFTLFY